MKTWYGAKEYRLKDWLKPATRGLCAYARQQIDEEISDHFSTAVEEAMEKGVSYPEAKKQVFQALGNPKAAKKHFQKIYLTPYQEKWIQQVWCLERYENYSTAPLSKFKMKLRLFLCIASLILLSLLWVWIAIAIGSYFGNRKEIFYAITIAITNVIFIDIFCEVLKVIREISRLMLYPSIPNPPYIAILKHANESITGIIICAAFTFWFFTLNVFWPFFVIGVFFGLIVLFQLVMSVNVHKKLKRYPTQNRTPVIEKMIRYSVEQPADELKPS